MHGKTGGEQQTCWEVESCEVKSTGGTTSVTSHKFDVAEVFILVGGRTGKSEVQGHPTGLKRRHSQGLGDWHERDGELKTQLRRGSRKCCCSSSTCTQRVECHRGLDRPLGCHRVVDGNITWPWMVTSTSGGL